MSKQLSPNVRLQLDAVRSELLQHAQDHITHVYRLATEIASARQARDVEGELTAVGHLAIHAEAMGSACRPLRQELHRLAEQARSGDERFLRLT